jgi:hypothetical protein
MTEIRSLGELTGVLSSATIRSPSVSPTALAGESEYTLVTWAPGCVDGEIVPSGCRAGPMTAMPSIPVGPTCASSEVTPDWMARTIAIASLIGMA